MESISNPNFVEEEARNWLELPADVTSMILLKLGSIDILANAQRVCSSWREICRDPLMWRVIDMRCSSGWWEKNYDLFAACNHALDRSCGQLTCISIEYFCNDMLLRSIIQRPNQLRKLRLVYCRNVSYAVLLEAFSKLPLLEDLEIVRSIFEEETLATLETLGKCCPLLKSLKLNGQFHREIECDKAALYIAKNLPNLRHLQIFGNAITNKGLQAILDGCADLESLDLRHCFNVSLVGQLGTICAERIQNLRLPHDPTDDYEFKTRIVDYDDGGDDDNDYDFSGLSDSDFLIDDEYYFDDFYGGGISDGSEYSFDGDLFDY